MILPFKNGDIVVTSPYGNRSLYGSNGFHSGLDMYSKSTKEIVSVSDGTVLWSQMVTDKNNPTWQWGNYVAVNGVDGNTVYYCHLEKRSVTSGQRVRAGDVIGIMGNTGYSLGAHLHFEVRPGNRTSTNAAAYLGITNTAHTLSERAYYEAELSRACGFTEGTRAYINGYAWARELWRKLAVLVRKRHGRALSKAEIINECGLLSHTVKYIDKYKFASEFWEKIGGECK